MNARSIPNLSRLATAEQVESAGSVDAECEDDDSPVLPHWRRRRRRRRQWSLTPSLGSRARVLVPSTNRSPSGSTEVDLTEKMNGFRRLQRERRAERAPIHPTLDVSSDVQAPFATNIVSTEARRTQPSSSRQSEPKRRGRKRKVVASELKTAVEKRSQTSPTWEVDRIMGTLERNGKLYYRVRWEDTLEPAENL